MAIRFCKGTSNDFDKYPKVRINKDFFSFAHKLFIDQEVEYLTVCSGDKPIAFCYNDEKCDVHLKRVFALHHSSAANAELCCLQKATIVSFNEIAYHMYLLLSAAGVDVFVKGDLWSDFVEGALVVEETVGHGFFCEGNEGLSLNDLGRWRASFPHEEYDYIENLYRKLLRNNSLYNLPMLEKAEVNQLVTEKIYKAEPFMIARLGNTEAMIAQEFISGSLSNTWTRWLLNTSGFYTTNDQRVTDQIEEYAQLTLNALDDCDIHLHCFESAINLINSYSATESCLADWYDLYVDFDEYSWTHALKSKRVLVVSSIGDTIDIQYNKRDSLFSINALPDFEIVHYRMPETQLGNGYVGYSWFELLNKIVSDISKIEFDVALISAGAYGYPLASSIKKMGKVVIELCSGLYPLFGIKNKTQQIIRRVSKHYNDNWIFPIETPPAQHEKIEKGAYWE